MAFCVPMRKLLKQFAAFVDLTKLRRAPDMRLHSAFFLASLPALLSSHAEALHHPPNTCPSETGILEPICKTVYRNSAADEVAEPLSKEHNDTSAESSWHDTGLCAESYCLHTNPAFGGGRGISIVTTNRNIQTLKSLLRNAGSRSQCESPPFHVSPIPGKGLGLLASRPLSRGSRILSQPPVILVHRTFLESHPPSSSQPILDAAVSLLPPATKALFLSQTGHSGRHRVTDILATNSFQTDIGGPDGEGHHYANYPAVSRFNHDCRPNVAFHIDEKLMHKTTAVRHVEVGEELSITYLDSFEPRAARRERALHAWGFKCSCAQCSLPEREAAESDGRLEEISRMQALLENWQGREVTSEVVGRYVQLFTDERLEVALAGAYTLAALNYNMLGDDELSRKFARLAIEAGKIEFGPEASDVKEMEVLMRDPRGHFSWRRRPW